jgi:hypothetical protein
MSNLFYITIAIVLFVVYHLLSCKKIEPFGTFYADKKWFSKQQWIDCQFKFYVGLDEKID